MKIFEISNKARNQIKLLQNLYVTYILDKSSYGELLDLLEYLGKSDDLDITKEVNIITQKLVEEILRTLSK